MATNTFYFFDGDPEDEAAWQAFVAAHSESVGMSERATSSSATIKTFYELFLILVIMVALVGTVLWQKDTTQIAALENQVQTLEEELAHLALAQETAAASASLTSQRSPLVHNVVNTDYLRFVVEPTQIAIVNEIAAQLDTAYGQLSADLALPVDPLGEKVNILLLGDSTDDTNFYADLGVIVINVASCAEPFACDAQSVSQEIYNNLYGQLARRLLDKALMTRQIRPEWGVVVTHLYAYVEQAHSVPSAATLPAYKLEQREYAQLLSVSALLLHRGPGDWMYPDYASIHAVADTFVEYAMVTYGLASIPPLLDAMSHYPEWDAVVTTVYGIPVEQLEQEWHAYLAQQYPAESPYAPLAE